MIRAKLTVAFFLLSLTCQAQVNNSSWIDQYWLDLGPGAYFTAYNQEGNVGNNEGLLFEGSANIRHKDLVVSGYYSRMWEVYGAISYPFPQEKRNSIGFLAGKTLSDRWFSFSLLAGAGMTWGWQRGAYIRHDHVYGIPPFRTDPPTPVYELYKFHAFTFPAKFNVTFMPLKFIGIGVTFEANYNTRRNLYAAMINLRIGHLNL